MAFQGDSIFWVEVDKIVPNPYQPRREFDDSKLSELAESVRMYGILQPLTVTRKEISREDGTFYTEYELIAGERRLRAARKAELSQVPVIIREGDDSEQEKLELAIIENLQREDLNAVDRALAFRQLADMFELSHAQVAKKVGRSREYVSNTIRLLQLPEYMLSSLKVRDITEGHARTLLMLNDRPEEQDTVYREILLKKLSVREVERIVRKIATDKIRKQSWKNTDAALIEIEKEFTESLGTRVQIAKTDYGGKISIDYFSDEDLQTLLERLKKDAKKSAVVSGVAVAAVSDGMDEITSEERAFIDKMEASTPLAAAETAPETPDETMENKAVETPDASPMADSVPIQPTVSETPAVGSAPDAPSETTDVPEETRVSSETETPPSIVVDETAAEAKPAHNSESSSQSAADGESAVVSESAAPTVSKPDQTIASETNESAASETPSPTTGEADPETDEALQVLRDLAAKTEPETPKDDDSDLYTIKNFGV